MAALLQRLGRHEEAVGHYQVALKLAPNNGLWLMGMGISLQALQRNEEARDAYQRALATNSLNAQLQGFVQQKLKEF
jgi:MSHA biogenesis protein MshN